MGALRFARNVNRTGAAIGGLAPAVLAIGAIVLVAHVIVLAFIPAVLIAVTWRLIHDRRQRRERAVSQRHQRELAAWHRAQAAAARQRADQWAAYRQSLTNRPI